MNPNRLSLWLSRIAAMTLKELKQLSRDPVLLVIIVYFFCGDVYLAGSGVVLSLRNASVMVMDHDHSAASRELVYRFRPPYFNLQGEVTSEQEAKRLLDHGKVLMVLDIPEHFQRDLLRGQPVDVQLQVDTSNTSLGTLASSYAVQITAAFGQEYAEKRLGLASELELPMIDDRHRVWYNPNQNDGWFMSISDVLNVVTMLAMMLPAAAAVREKERGTIEQLAVSPLTPFQILFPKVIAMGLVILLGTAVSLFLIIMPVFHLPVKGSLWLFFTVTALYVFATAGIGLFIATISRNLGQVSMLVILLMMPIMLLSGSWTPPEAMPIGLQWAMYVSPLFYYTELSYDILLKGAGVEVLWDVVLKLAALGLLVFGFGVWWFRRQFG